MAPYNPAASGPILEFLAFLLIGMAFGAVLEMSGFGDSRKLAAQFYLRDMTVLKVMFTGIVVAAVLIHLASSLEFLDVQRVWVNPTYLWPGIAGGLIMGVGFIVGGFCPGTSLVAAATWKLDGAAFVLGGLGGVFLFGETVRFFDGWWHSSFHGRLTLGDWMGLPAGIALLMFVLMALGMFVAAEAAERRFGGGTEPARARTAGIARRRARLAAGVLILLAVLTAVLGQPRAEERWSWIAGRSGRDLAARAVHVSPAEVVDLRRDLSLAVRILEVRSESDYNLFHLAGSRRIDLDDTREAGLISGLTGAPDNQILFLVSNGERDATEAWKRLKAEGVINLYVIEGGINAWLDAYPPHPCVAERTAGAAEAMNGPDAGAFAYGEAPAWRFRLSVGDRIPSAHPDVFHRDPLPDCAGAAALQSGPEWFDGSHSTDRPYTRKVAIQKKVAARGGCG